MRQTSILEFACYGSIFVFHCYSNLHKNWNHLTAVLYLGMDALNIYRFLKIRLCCICSNVVASCNFVSASNGFTFVFWGFSQDCVRRPFLGPRKSGRLGQVGVFIKRPQIKSGRSWQVLSFYSHCESFRNKKTFARLKIYNLACFGAIFED